MNYCFKRENDKFRQNFVTLQISSGITIFKWISSTVVIVQHTELASQVRIPARIFFSFYFFFFFSFFFLSYKPRHRMTMKIYLKEMAVMLMNVGRLNWKNILIILYYIILKRYIIIISGFQWSSGCGCLVRVWRARGAWATHTVIYPHDRNRESWPESRGLLTSIKNICVGWFHLVMLLPIRGILGLEKTIIGLQEVSGCLLCRRLRAG